MNGLIPDSYTHLAGLPLVLHKESLKRIEDYFKGRVWGPTQKKQAYLPQGCTVFQNDMGKMCIRDRIESLHKDTQRP